MNDKLGGCGPLRTAHPRARQWRTRRAIECHKSRRPALTFIQLNHVDHAGHEFGHGTPHHYAAVAVADQLIGEVISAIQEAGIKDSTLLLVTSDHGGKDKGHGGTTQAEIEIPWILAGPGVRAGHEIKSPVNIYATAATIAFALALKPPEAWIARPVTEAFARSKN
jgi:predicted AlkP superfamily pyrophosphatase or phosphodiesterase